MARRILPHGPQTALAAALLAMGEIAIDETLKTLRVGDGSTLGGNIITGFNNQAGFSAPSGIARSPTAKMVELGVSLMDYGAIPNVNTPEAATANKAAMDSAFSVSGIVDVPGDASWFYALPPGCVIPASKTLQGKGAELVMRGEGISLNNFSKLRGLAITGLNTRVAAGTKGSGVLGRATPTPDSQQYALVYLNTKVGCVVELTYLAHGLINGVQANNGSFHRIIIDKAENFGNDGVFSPTEGSIVYAPELRDSVITVRDGAQTYGLGAVMGLAWTRNIFDLYIHDTRRAALHCPWEAGLSRSGPGNEVYIRAERLGGLAPVLATPPANHNQTGCGVFWIGAPKAEYVKIINPVIIDFAENAFEGTMEIINPTVEITQTNGAWWDADKQPPNPGVFYGSQKIRGGVANNCRGWVLHAGGEEGALLLDIYYDGVAINNPRWAIINNVNSRPKFMHLQPHGSAAFADNVVVRNCVGYDSTGNVIEGFVASGTGGAWFKPSCKFTNNSSSVGNNNIDPRAQQIGNSWNPLTNKSTPHYMGIDAEEPGGGYKRSYWGYAVSYDPTAGSWKLDDFGAERTLIVHGSNSIQMFIIPRTVPAGALSNNDLQQYLVFNGNKAGFGPRVVTTAQRPDDTAGAFPGLLLFDSTADTLIVRNAANTAWKTVTTT